MESRIVAAVLSGWASAWALTTVGAPGGVAVLLGALVAGLTAATLRRR